MNEHGVAISLFAGGTTNERSLNYNGQFYIAEGFGVPWFHLFLYTGVHATTASQAIEMLTVGPPDYRTRTGRAALLRGGGWIFMVCDAKEMAVVEVTADRYAVRRPGEFTGPEWTDPDFIVATNHNLCPFSFDEHHRRTDIPMTIFGDGVTRDDAGTISGLDNSGIRFWTLMWDIKRQRGNVDARTAEEIMSGLHSCDRESGKMTTNMNEKERISGRACNQGTVSLSGGTADGKVPVCETWARRFVGHWGRRLIGVAIGTRLSSTTQAVGSSNALSS